MERQKQIDFKRHDWTNGNLKKERHRIMQQLIIKDKN